LEIICQTGSQVRAIEIRLCDKCYFRRKKSAGSSSSESESSDSEEEKGSSKQSSDEDDQPIMEQIKSRVESQDNPQHHTSDEDDNNGMDMDMTNDDHQDSPPPTRAPIRLPGLESKFKSHSRSNSPAFTQRDPEKRSRKVASVFQEDEDEENQPEKIKKRKPNPKENVKMSAEERKKVIKGLIERIPTDRGALFAYPIRWEYLDGSGDLMEKRIIPWIKKKLIEIIGEDEPTLVEFVSTRLKHKTKPEYILQEIKIALDEEADMFVVKLWRLLIYETEAREEGINQ